MTRRSPWLRVGVSLAILAGLAWALDPGEIAGRLRTLRPRWVLVALLLSVVQVVVSAGRWRFTAHRLGIALGWRAAIREYYLATFLNQLLPGGVLGDVSRAWRHGRPPSEVEGRFDLRAAHAVILERASGQFVMIAVALASGAMIAARVEEGVALWLLWGPVLLAIAGVVLAAVVLPRLGRHALAGPLLGHARRALAEGSALPIQLASSLVVVATYLATWIAATRAVGISTPTAMLLPLVAPILVTMLIPITVAGWGLREAGAAALWALVGLTAPDGVAVSLSYGLLVLLGSLPGGLALVGDFIQTRGRNRRADRHPDGSGAPEA